jgi:hypothetical protein
MMMKVIFSMLCPFLFMADNAFAGGMFCKVDGDEKKEVRAIYDGTPGAAIVSYLEKGVEIINYGSIMSSIEEFSLPRREAFAGRVNNEAGILTVYYLKDDQMSTAVGFFTRIVGTEVPRVYTVSCECFE